MLAWLISFVTGGGLASITGQIADAYKAKQNALTDAAKIEADAQISTLEAQRDVLVAEVASGGLQSWIRPLFALPFVIYDFKIVVWDKVLGWGVTDPLSADLVRIEMIVITAYFLSRGAEKVTRIIKG